MSVQTLLSSTRCQVVVAYDRRVAIQKHFPKELTQLILSFDVMTRAEEIKLGKSIAERWTQLVASNDDLFYQAALSTALFQFAMHGMQLLKSPIQSFQVAQIRIGGLYPQMYVRNKEHFDISPLDLPCLAHRDLILSSFDPYAPLLWGGNPSKWFPRVTENVWSHRGSYVNITNVNYYSLSTYMPEWRFKESLYLAPFTLSGKVFCPLVVASHRTHRGMLYYDKTIPAPSIASNNLRIEPGLSDLSVFLPIARQVVKSQPSCVQDLVDWVLASSTSLDCFVYYRFRSCHV